MYQLGTIRFEGLKGFDTLRVARAAVYAEVPLISGKPRLQRTGTALQDINVTAVLHAAFADITSDIAALDGHREAGDIMPLISGEGEVFGDFVVVTVEQQIIDTTPLGKPLSAEVTMTLREYYDPNKPATEAIAAAANAFAVGSDKVVPVRVVRVQQSPMAAISAKTASGNAASNSAIAGVRASVPNAAQQASLFARAKRSLDQAKEAYQAVKETVQAYNDIAAKAPQLEPAATQVLANVEAVRAAVADGDLTNALTNATALELSVAGVSSAVLPLNAILITRNPQ